MAQRFTKKEKYQLLKHNKIILPLLALLLVSTSPASAA